MKKILSLILAMTILSTFLVGCTPKKEEKKDVSLSEIHTAIKEELGEDYIPNMEMTLEDLENLTGVNKDDVEEHIMEAPMISVNVDTFIAIKAKEGKAEAVEKALEDYRTNLVENSLQYPMNLAKVEASKVVRHGDYVFFLMIGALDERAEATDEERLEFAQGEIKKAEDVIEGFFK